MKSGTHASPGRPASRRLHSNNRQPGSVPRMNYGRTFPLEAVSANFKSNPNSLDSFMKVVDGRSEEETPGREFPSRTSFRELVSDVHGALIVARPRENVQ